ncbi:MAG: peptidylprolyl isomerase [Ottowia sp.]|nr:peptidylprolyl isomerase [Ottowia sp.]
MHRTLSILALCLLLALAGAPDSALAQGSTAKTAKTAKAAAKKPAKKSAKKPAKKAAKRAASSAAPAAAPAVLRGADHIVAVVNSEPITDNEVRAAAARVRHQMQQKRQNVPPEGELRRAVLERLISERAQQQYAKENGLDVSDSALAQAELSIARQNQLATVQELHERLKQEGINVDDFQRDLRGQVLLARLREREIEPRLSVSESEIDSFIREQTGVNPADMLEINLAMILVAVPEGADAATIAPLQARAQDIARRATAGEDFAKLASEYSDAYGRGSDGGVLGLRPASRYPDLFVRSTQRARAGEIVGPVRSAAGFHVLKVLERRQSRDLPETHITQTHVSHILLPVDERQTEATALARATDLRRRIASGAATFEALAREYSSDASAADGGALGWVLPGQFVPEFEQAMNNLDPGQLSEPVVSRFGVHLIRVDDRRQHTLSSTEQRELARNMLREKKAQEAFETWAREVRGRAWVELREEPL